MLAAAAAASRSLVCRLAMWFFFHVCRTLYGIHRFVGTIRFSVQSAGAFGMLEKSSSPPRTTRWKSLFPPQLELFFFLLLHFAYCTIFPSAVLVLLNFARRGHLCWGVNFRVGEGSSSWHLTGYLLLRTSGLLDVNFSTLCELAIKGAFFFFMQSLQNFWWN